MFASSFESCEDRTPQNLKAYERCCVREIKTKVNCKSLVSSYTLSTNLAQRINFWLMKYQVTQPSESNIVALLIVNINYASLD